MLNVESFDLLSMLEIGYLTGSLFRLKTVDAGMGNGDMELFARC